MDETRRLLGVFAHPDDESYGIAGLYARLASEDRARTALLCLTRGEASSMGPARGLSPAEVAALRTRRLEQVAEIVGLDELHVADLPDGGLAGLPQADVAGAIRRVVDAFRPHVVVTHCARGVNGHADHVATHWAVRRALEDRPGVRLALVAYRRAACEAVAPRVLFATRDDDVSVTITLSEEEIDAKEACLREHEAVATIIPARAAAEGLLLRPAIEELALYRERLEPPRDDVFYGLSIR